jgi:hypothetical protein
MPTLRLLPELEEALRQIPGVRAASVVTGPDAVPTEVHVLAAPGKAPKQVVRDVQSLALARYDLDIDHRIVSVVQIGEDEPVAGAAEPTVAARPAITGITVRTTGDQTHVTVQVTSGEDQFEGRASGPVGPTHRPRVVAGATLDALAELLGRPCQVESATIVRAGQREVALSVLTLSVPRIGEQVLTGTAVVRSDDADAVSRSVLDALNRQLAG